MLHESFIVLLHQQFLDHHEAKVSHLDIPLGIKQQVEQLEIPVHNAQQVEEVHALGHLLKHFELQNKQYLGDKVVVYQVEQAPQAHELHDDEHLRQLVAHPHELHNIGMNSDDDDHDQQDNTNATRGMQLSAMKRTCHSISTRTRLYHTPSHSFAP